jgi:hypothetical protein
MKEPRRAIPPRGKGALEKISRSVMFQAWERGRPARICPSILFRVESAKIRAGRRAPRGER